MSYEFPTLKERQLFIHKKKHLRNIMLFNQQQAAFKQRILTEQQQQIHHQSLLEEESTRQALRLEREEWCQRRKRQRKALQASYDRQIELEREKRLEQKRKNREYFMRQMMQMEYEQDRRIQEMSRMFRGGQVSRRPSSKHSHSNQSRIKTEGHETNLNPQSRLRKKNTTQDQLLSSGRKLARPVTEGAVIPDYQISDQTARSRACSLPFIDPSDSLDRLTVECQLRRPFPHGHIKEY